VLVRLADDSLISPVAAAALVAGHSRLVERCEQQLAPGIDQRPRIGLLDSLSRADAAFLPLADALNLPLWQ
jgi:hypothetical protein